MYLDRSNADEQALANLGVGFALRHQAEYVQLPGQTGAAAVPPMGIDDLTTEHMANWLECLRARTAPHCTVDDGFAHSVACTMAAQAYWSGKRLYWDAGREAIVEKL